MRGFSNLHQKLVSRTSSGDLREALDAMTLTHVVRGVINQRAVFADNTCVASRER